MRIGFVRRGHSATGGAEAYMLRLASELQKSGGDCVLVTTPDWPTERWPFGNILRIEARGPKEFAEAFLEMKTGCDVHLSLERVLGCEVFRAGDGVHAAWLERRNSFEPLWKKLGRLLNRKHSRTRDLERQVFSSAMTRAVIVNSAMVRDEILARFPYPAEKIHLVPNGVRPFGALPPRSESRNRLGIAPDVFCPLFLGTGWERKGLSIALKAVEMMETTELLVAGRGPADLYQSGKARFLGPVSDLHALFAAADVLVAPTWYDPFSNACLEALSAGLPVITTPANGFSEILEPGIHGDIVPTGDALALAESLEKWKLPGRSKSAGSACSQRASEFSIEQNARETLEILKSAAR